MRIQTPREPSSLQPLWEPLDIGHLTIKNRVVMTAHGLGVADRYLMSEASVAYYRERARGGVGMIISAAQGVHRSATGAILQEAFRPEVVAVYRRAAEAVHQHDCRFVVQLSHNGAEDQSARLLDNYRALMSPSGIPSAVTGATPRAMEVEDLEAICAGFAVSAANAHAAGVDGVEIHSGHGFLLHQFLSPLTNHREDDYGGSTENRCRYALEIARAIKARCGDAFPLGVRLSFDEFTPGGLEPVESERILRTLDASGLFSYFSISAGNMSSAHRFISPMSVEPGVIQQFALRAKAVVGTAAILTCSRVTDVAHAAQLVRDGVADLVGMTRAHIADPYVVQKARAGREQEIRRCINVNQGCINRDILLQAVTCTQNPVAGREEQWGGELETTEHPRRVLVIGAGPAGLKAAEVASGRGHAVTVIERENEIGGQVRYAAMLPTRAKWALLTENLRCALDANGVEVRTGTEATAELIEREAPDAVIIATGARYARTGHSPALGHRAGIPGLEHTTVLDPIEAIEDHGRCGHRVLIVDEHGDYTALGLAEHLADNGHDVEIVTRHLHVGAATAATLDMGHVYPRVTSKGVVLTPQHVVDAITESGAAVITRVWDGAARLHAVDSVVLSMTRLPQIRLYRELRSRGIAHIHRIGDCLAPRQVDEAMYEGEQIGRAL
jgi:2,4-dienoyl-CoA reductase-like NADH-dependent reductase (Old Yellow Enzyme family)/thioredoxin reductase